MIKRITGSDWLSQSEHTKLSVRRLHQLGNLAIADFRMGDATTIISGVTPMEPTTQLLISLSAALGALSLFVILRRTMNSASTPEWIANGVVAAVLALLLTIAFAGSTFFLGYVLSFFVSGGIAFFGTFVIHGALFAFCSFVLPTAERATKQQASVSPNQTVGASA